MIYTDTGRAAAGEPLLRKGLETARRVFVPHDRRLALAAADVDHCLTVEGKYDEAEPLLLDAARDLEAAPGPDHPRTHLAKTWLEELRRKRGGT